MANKLHSGYKYIFGPVPSRRLGISLGVDLVPHKTCTLDCVYCECGKTTCLTLKRNEYIPSENIKAELEAFLTTNPNLDFITFSGAGEPTLHSEMGEIVRFLKNGYPQYKVALLTNGTLFYDPGVREDALRVDLVKVSLDAVSEKLFFHINRPHRGLEISRLIDGWRSFKRDFNGKFWVEVFLLPGVNDGLIELKKIKQVLHVINPDRIQLNTLDRPGTEYWVKPAEQKSLKKIASYLYDADIIKGPETGQTDDVSKEDFCKRFLSTIKRRPFTAEDISRTFGIQLNDVPGYLEDLIDTGEIEKKEMSRGIFYMKRNQVS